MSDSKSPIIVRYLDQTPAIECPYGNVRRVVSGGEYPVANIHVVTVSRGGEHYHQAYDETYYILAGMGRITLDGEEHALRPGAVVVIPAGVPHSLEADDGTDLTFVIFGTPGVSIDGPEAMPRKVGSRE